MVFTQRMNDLAILVDHMYRRVILAQNPVAALAVLGMGIGCARPTVNLTPVAQSPDAEPTPYDDRPWATVVRENVKDGLVDYDHLSAHRESLDEYLRLIASVGPERTPEQFPTRESRICYYINAYHASMLAGVLHAGIPETMYGFGGGPPDHRYRLHLDGRWMRVDRIRQRAVEESDHDVRVWFALCDAAMDSPPLHNQPFRPQGLAETLRRLSVAAMDNHRIVSVHHGKRALMLSTILVAHRDEFIAYYEHRTRAVDATLLNVVLHFAGHVRRQWLNTAVGYTEQIIPFDRTLNRWQPSKTGVGP